jgi:WD40 repeat protein
MNRKLYYEFQDSMGIRASSLTFIHHKKFITSNSYLIVGLDRIQIHSDTITRIQKHRDQGLFTTSSMDKKLKVFDAETIECVYEFKMHEKIFNHVLQGTVAAVCSLSKYVRLADLNSGSMIQQLYSSSPIISMDWSPCRDYLLLGGCEDGNVILWDIRKSDTVLITEKVSPTRIHGVLFDGIHFFASSQALLGYYDGLSMEKFYSVEMRHVNPSRYVVPCIVNDILMHPSQNGSIYCYKKNLFLYELQGHLKPTFCIVSDNLQVSSLSSESIIDWIPSLFPKEEMQDNWD